MKHVFYLYPFLRLYFGCLCEDKSIDTKLGLSETSCYRWSPLGLDKNIGIL